MKGKTGLQLLDVDIKATDIDECCCIVVVQR